MIHNKGNAGKPASREWHEFRARARRTAFSPAEFSDDERVRYNLDDDARISPAGITGEENPATYNGSDPVGLKPLPTTPVESDPTR